MQVVPGREYEVYIGFINNGHPDHNETGETIAKQVRLASFFPREATPDKDGIVSAIISASNTKPLQVWDGATFVSSTFVSSEKVAFRYKPGSARLYNGKHKEGLLLPPEKLFNSEGVLLGRDELNGLVHAGGQYSGHVRYILVAE